MRWIGLAAIAALLLACRGHGKEPRAQLRIHGSIRHVDRSCERARSTCAAHERNVGRDGSACAVRH